MQVRQLPPQELEATPSCVAQMLRDFIANG